MYLIAGLTVSYNVNVCNNLKMYLIPGFCEYWPLPLLPPVPETLPRGNQRPPWDPISLLTPCDHLLQGRPPYFSVYL